MRNVDHRNLYWLPGEDRRPMRAGVDLAQFVLPHADEDHIRFFRCQRRSLEVAMQTFNRPLGGFAFDLALELPTVHLVDSDASVRRALERLLVSHAYRVRSYPTGEEFLACFDARLPGCLLLDVSIPDIGGLEVFRRLKAAGYCPPTVFTSGVADVFTCASAMRAGAIHFLTKPIDQPKLLLAVEEAMGHDAVLRSDLRQRSMVTGRLASLTPREREVLDRVMDGRLNKQIAAELGTAEKTVKVQRARAMEKMGCRCVAEVVRMVERAAMADTHLDVRGKGHAPQSFVPSDHRASGNLQLA
jgi:FixJ family two-component response regulator